MCVLSSAARSGIFSSGCPFFRQGIEFAGACACTAEAMRNVAMAISFFIASSLCHDVDRAALAGVLRAAVRDRRRRGLLNDVTGSRRIPGWDDLRDWTAADGDLMEIVRLVVPRHDVVGLRLQRLTRIDAKDIRI